MKRRIKKMKRSIKVNEHNKQKTKRGKTSWIRRQKFKIRTKRKPKSHKIWIAVDGNTTIKGRGKVLYGNGFEKFAIKFRRIRTKNLKNPE